MLPTYIKLIYIYIALHVLYFSLKFFFQKYPSLVYSGPPCSRDRCHFWICLEPGRSHGIGHTLVIRWTILWANPTHTATRFIAFGIRRQFPLHWNRIGPIWAGMRRRFIVSKHCRPGQNIWADILRRTARSRQTPHRLLRAIWGDRALLFYSCGDMVAIRRTPRSCARHPPRPSGGTSRNVRRCG